MYIRKCMMAPCVIQFSSSVFFPLCSYCYQGSCPRTIPLPHIVVYCSVVIMPGLQQVRLPCPSPSPGICSNSCPLMPSDHLVLCHPTISSSVVPFSSCPQSFPASGSFPMSQLFTSGGQRTGVAASVLPVNIQG